MCLECGCTRSGNRGIVQSGGLPNDTLAEPSSRFLRRSRKSRQNLMSLESQQSGNRIGSFTPTLNTKSRPSRQRIRKK